MNDATFRILVTNDDGVSSTGLAVLANHLAAAGHTIVVAAPPAEASGSSAAIGGIMAGDTVSSSRVELPAANAPYPAFAVEGPPGRSVLAASIGAFGPPPDLVISGINPGANVGRFLQLHSGTLGAALTAAGLGIKAMAVSIDNTEPTHWDTAGVLAARLVGFLSTCEARTSLNFNAPDRPLDEIKGLRTAPVRSERVVRFTLKGEAPGIQTMGHEMLGPKPGAPEISEDTDRSLVLDGYAVLTSVVAPADVPVGALPRIFN